MNKRKILALLLAAVMICSLFVSPALAADDEGIVAISDNTEAPKFTDLEENHWAASAINRWAAEGIAKGDGDGTIQPARNLRRAELATILTRLLGLKDKAPADTFSDVAADAWYADAVLQCAKAGIMLGDGTGKANPEAAIDRQQAIVMIGRAVGVKPASGDSLDRFQDGDTVADWAAPYMIAMTNMEILGGLPAEGGYVVAPNEDIDRASTFTLLDKAIAQYITAPCTVTVDDANKFVIVNSAAEEAGTVTVTGKTAGVVVAVGTTDNVVLDKAEVGTLKVDAPVDVTVSRGSSVTDLDANAAADVTNNGTVTNLNTNADDVTFDGNKPSKVNTAEGVKPATDSKGNEVTDKPTNSGGNNTGSTSYKYKVSIPSTVGGTVTADVTRTNTADTVVTLTVTPDAQTATALPYVLKSLIVKNGETTVDVTEDNTFTMAAEGTYTVTAEFYQPLTEAELFIVNSEETFNHLADFGYTDTTTDMADLPVMQWIAVGVKRAEGLETKIVDAVLTANGTDMSSKAWPGEFGKYSMAYVDENTRGEDENGAKLELKGSAYKFVLTFTYEGAAYELECDYLKHGVTEADLHTVTFKTDAGTELASYKAAQGDTVTAPAAPAIDGYYFTGWDTALIDNQFTVGEADATITAEYVKIGDQELQTRPNGPANNGDTDFDYAAAYEAAGVTFTGTAGNYTYTIDATTFLNYAAQQDNKLSVLAAEVNGKTYYFYGAAIMAPADATTLVLTKDNALTSLDDAAKRTEFDLANSEHSFTIDNQKCILHYFGAVAEKDAQGVYGFQPDGAFVRYAKWVDSEGNITVNKIVLNRKTTPAKLNVTFKADGETVETKTVDYNTAIGEALPEVPAAKPGYTGKWMAGDTEVTAETKITADTEVVAEYTAIQYTVTVDGTTKTMTVEDKDTMDNTQSAFIFGSIMEFLNQEKPGYVLQGCNIEVEGKEPTFNPASIAAALTVTTLPIICGDKTAVTFTTVWAPNYEVSFAAMSDAVYDLYKGDDEFSVGIPATLDLFQEDIAFEAGEKDCTFAVKGTLNAITDPAYAGFNQANAGEQTGYYLLFQFVAPEGTKAGAQGNIVTTAKKNFTAANLDVVNEEEVFSFIWWVAAADAENLNDQTIELTIDWDGNGEKTGTKYTLDLSGLTLKAAEANPDANA